MLICEFLLLARKECSCIGFLGSECYYFNDSVMKKHAQSGSDEFRHEL